MTLPSDTVRDGETFVLTWSVLPMSSEEIRAENAAQPDGFETVDGFSASVEFDIVTGPVEPCEPVEATSP